MSNTVPVLQVLPVVTYLLLLLLSTLGLGPAPKNSQPVNQSESANLQTDQTQGANRKSAKMCIQEFFKLFLVPSVYLESLNKTKFTMAVYTKEHSLPWIYLFFKSDNISLYLPGINRF